MQGQLLIIFQDIKSSQAHFLEKSLVVIAVCPRQSAFRESETHFSSFSQQALLLLCRPLAINCLHSSLLTTLPSYLFSCKMLGLIGEKVVKKNPSTSSSLRKLNRVASNLRAEIRQDLKTCFQFFSYEASQSTYIFIMTPDRSIMKSFKCKKNKYFVTKKVCSLANYSVFDPFLLKFRKRANGRFNSISINMNINLITNSRSAQPGSTYSFFALFFPCLQVISAQPDFFALGGTPYQPKDTLGSFMFCLACDLLCFLFVFCLAAVKERVGQGQA